MNKPLLAAGALLLMGIGTAGAVYVASSGSEEEVVQQVLTATARTSASGSPSPTASTSPSPIISASPGPTPSAAPVPEDWATYSVPEAGLSLRYPPAWYALNDGGIHSWNPATWDKPYIPPESVSIDVIYGSSDYAEPRPGEATDFSTGADAGWEITYMKNPTVEDGLTRVHQIALERGEFTLFIIVSFSQTSPDEETFSQIVHSARFAVSGINVGLFCSTPSVGLARDIGRKQAMEMLLTGDFIDARTALERGLVNRVVPEDELDAELNKLADAILSKSPVAVKSGKQMFYRHLEMRLAEAY